VGFAITATVGPFLRNGTRLQTRSSRGTTTGSTTSADVSEVADFRHQPTSPKSKNARAPGIFRFKLITPHSKI
jgi:hypothetical protein